MKVIKKLLVVIIVLAMIQLHASITANGEDFRKKDESVKVQLIWKQAFTNKLIPDFKTFPPPEIQKEINSAKSTEVAKTFLINTLRKLVAKHDRMIFFEGGKMIDIKATGYPVVYFSPSSKYVGIGGGMKGITEREIKEIHMYPMESLPLTQLLLFNREGEQLWRKTLLPPWVNILDNGDVGFSFCPGFSQRCYLELIIDRNGNEVFNIKDKKNYSRELIQEEIPIFAFWEQRGFPPSTSILWLFSSNGQVTLRKDLNKLSGWPPILSDKGKYVFLNGDHGWPQTQRLLNNKGKIISELSFYSPTKIDFSPNGEYLALIDNKKSLNIIKSSSGKIIWINPKMHINNNLWNVQISNNGEYVLMSGRLAPERSGKNDLDDAILFNKKGEVIWSERKGYSEVFMADEGSYFYIETKDTLYCYGVKN
jgi:hypothetical protein